MEGLKVWVSVLLEYDKYGAATVLRSFAKPAADSTVKSVTKSKKTAKKTQVIRQDIEEELF